MAGEILGRALAPGGGELVLSRHGAEYVIAVGGKPLMASGMHGSEEALATLAWPLLPVTKRPRVLVGGLGMGFTLRAVLNLLPPGGKVTVAELIPAVVDWNRGPLAGLAGHPLEDVRVTVETGSVLDTMRGGRARFDAVLLDVDNGPASLTTRENAGLYGDAGIALAHDALSKEGVLAVWSANDDRRFERRLRARGFDVRVEHVRARLEKGGPRHTIFLAKKMAAAR